MSDDRYSRQILFEGVGEVGQRRLHASRVVLVGCGALGSVMAGVLVRSGIGYLRVVDRDYVERSNLQRQVLFDERDAAEGSPKAVAAAVKLSRANSEIIVEPVVADLAPDNAERLLRDADLVLDGTDNFDCRYLINDVCVKYALRWVYAAAVASYGALMPIVPGETACLRCVFAEPLRAGTVDTCDTSGVLATAPGVIGNLAATEAIKLLVGASDRVAHGLLWFDVWHNTIERTPAVGPMPNCPACQQRRFQFLDAEAGSRSAVLCGRDAVQIRPSVSSIDLGALAGRLRSAVGVRVNDHLLRFKAGAYELTVFRDGRAIVKGTSEPAVARGLYAKYVGG
jgi:molybdopterin/thiamine biosynthesis adenylyltransferase